MKKTGHRWVIGVFLAACLMVVTGAAVANSSTTSAWPAKCKTVTCVNRYLNAIHASNVIRNGRILTLQTQMAANATYHRLNTAQHAAFTKDMAGYDAAIAALTSKMDALNKTVAGYDAQIAALNDQAKVMKGQIADLKAANEAYVNRIVALETWKASVQKYVSHIDVTVANNGITTTAPDGVYMLLFEKADAAPPPIFP